MTNSEKTAVASKPKPKARSLAANLDKHNPDIGVECWYWLGAFPQCVGEGLDVAGVNFPKLVETVKAKGLGGKTTRTPRIGALVKLPIEKVELIREKLAACVIRFTEKLQPETFDTDANGNEQRSGHQTDAMDYTQKRRQGHPIRIPTDAALKEARKHGRMLRQYVRRPLDEPAADYLFAVPCANQDSPARGEAYPEPLSQTGLPWPED